MHTRVSTYKGVRQLVEGFRLFPSTVSHPNYSGCIAALGKKIAQFVGRGEYMEGFLR